MGGEIMQIALKPQNIYSAEVYIWDWDTVDRACGSLKYSCALIPQWHGNISTDVNQRY